MRCVFNFQGIIASDRVDNEALFLFLRIDVRGAGGHPPPPKL